MASNSVSLLISLYFSICQNKAQAGISLIDCQEHPKPANL